MPIFFDKEVSVKREILAGLTTFFTMAYIIIVAPTMYHQAGANFDVAFTATCIVTVLATLLVALYSNLPIGMAPGLGLMSYLCFEVVGRLGFSWHMGLAAVFISGLVFMVITVTRIRQFILRAIPRSMGLAVAAGIGFFIGFLALRNAGIIVSDPATLLTLGPLAHGPALLFFLGFFLITVLDGYGVPGSILLGMIVVTVLGDLFGLNHFNGVFALPHFAFSHFGMADLAALWHPASIPVLFTFVIIALFDSTGTLLGLTSLIHFASQEEANRKINRALLMESCATTGAALIGASTLSPFVESAAGIKAGGKTGLTGLVIAGCFLLSLFLGPLAGSIPPFATASALFYVACMMVKPFAGVNFDDPTELIPAVMILFIIPLSFSIADGVGIGIICYVALKGARREWAAIHPMLWVLMLIFLVYFGL
jgi:AGZA family xanthine/uracil permease-like MFS transporter